MPPDQWTPPTSYNDPDNDWTDETKAYDGQTSTSANSAVHSQQWTKWLELLINPIQCSKVRMWAFCPSTSMTVHVDVYYNGAWHNIFNGAPNHLNWTEAELVGTYEVTKARFQQYCLSGYPISYLYEFAFWEVTAPPPPEIETQDATGIKSDEAMLHTKVLDDKGKTLSVRHNYGKTIAYGENTPWQEGKHTNDVISQTLTNLDPETEYHFRGEAFFED